MPLSISYTANIQMNTYKYDKESIILQNEISFFVNGLYE